MFCAYQQWRRRTPSAGPPRARIMRIGAANRLAQVAECRAAAGRNPDAEKAGIRATLAPVQMADANE